MRFSVAIVLMLMVVSVPHDLGGSGLELSVVHQQADYNYSFPGLHYYITDNGGDGEIGSGETFYVDIIGLPQNKPLNYSGNQSSADVADWDNHDHEGKWKRLDLDGQGQVGIDTDGDNKGDDYSSAGIRDRIVVRDRGNFPSGQNSTLQLWAWSDDPVPNRADLDIDVPIEVTPWNTVNLSFTDLAPASVEVGSSTALLALHFTPLSHGSVLDQLDVRINGNIPDGDVAAVSLYLDDGDLSFSALDDTALGPGVPVGGGMARFDRLLLPLPTGENTTVFAVANLSFDSSTGDTISLEVRDSAGVGILNLSTVDATFLPGLSNTSTVVADQTVTTATFSGSALMPAEVSQGDTVTVSTLTLGSDGPVVINELNLSLDGTVGDLDIASVSLYEDLDADGDPGGETLLDAAVFVNGRTTLANLGITLGLGQVKQVVVTLRLDQAATVLATVGITVDNATVSSGDLYTGLPHSSGLALIRPPPDRITAISSSLSPGVIEQASADLPMLDLAFNSTNFTQELNGLDVDLLGNISSADVDQISLWDGGALLATTAPVLGSASLTGFSLPLPTGGLGLTVAVSISPFAVVDATVGVSVSAISLGYPHPVSGLPQVSALSFIAPSVLPVLSVDPVSLAGDFVLPGSAGVPLIGIDLATTHDEVNLTQIEVQLRGSINPALVSRLWLWQDGDGDGVADIQLANGTFPANGVLVLSLLQAVNSGGTSLILSVDLDAATPLGTTVGLQLADNFALAEAGIIYSVATPFESDHVEVAALPALPENVTAEQLGTTLFVQLGWEMPAGSHAGVVFDGYTLAENATGLDNATVRFVAANVPSAFAEVEDYDNYTFVIVSRLGDLENRSIGPNKVTLELLPANQSTNLTEEDPGADDTPTDDEDRSASAVVVERSIFSIIIVILLGIIVALVLTRKQKASMDPKNPDMEDLPEIDEDHQ